MDETFYYIAKDIKDKRLGDVTGTRDTISVKDGAGKKKKGCCWWLKIQSIMWSIKNSDIDIPTYSQLKSPFMAVLK